MKPRFIFKYMRMAKFLAEDQPVCYSRHIGTVVADPETGKCLSVGYNGPPSGSPHCDHPEFLQQLWPKLKREEQRFALKQIPDYVDQVLEFHDNATKHDVAVSESIIESSLFVGHYANCKQCPRRTVGARSGERGELCPCIHSEDNALRNATSPLNGASVFIWSNPPVLPCKNCAKLMIDVGIKTIYCVEGTNIDYDPVARTLLKDAGVELIIKTASFYLEDS